MCFNSTLVQLKATRPNLQHELAIRFNSTLVQLKAGIDSRLTSAYGEFQFYLSSIKRISSKSPD